MPTASKIVAQNRRARHDYHIEEHIEAGLALTGSEVHRKELNRLLGQVRRAGYTLVPLSIYFNARGLAKLDLGLAKGKRKEDRREDVKQRDWQRQKARLLRDRG